MSDKIDDLIQKIRDGEISLEDARHLQEEHRRGWSSVGLRVIDADDPNYWSTADASKLLGPPYLSQGQVRQLVHLAGLQPAGKRRMTPSGKPGRHVRVYSAVELIKAYDAVSNIIGELVEDSLA